jgi:predicted transcriptional regulator
LQRGRWDIMARVLRIAQSPASKTHIMYGANLSYSQLERYLDFLLEKELLQRTEDASSRVKILYLTTATGCSFLNAYQKLKIIVEDQGLATS